MVRWWFRLVDFASVWQSQSGLNIKGGCRCTSKQGLADFSIVSESQIMDLCCIKTVFSVKPECIFYEQRFLHCQAVVHFYIPVTVLCILTNIHSECECCQISLWVCVCLDILFHLWEMDCLTIIYNLKNIENKICIVYYICYHIITNITLLINNYK